MSNEEIKAQSNFLRGTIAESIEAGGSHFGEDDLQLLKFHGAYQQENRDERAARRAAGVEKAYQFMVRSRIPGGALTARQYLVHDELARRFGNGTVRFTTRQGIQLHGVLKGSLRPAIRAIDRALLSTLAACGDVNRNVMACAAPLPGKARERIQELAARLARHLSPRTKAYHEIWIDGEQVRSAEEDVEPLYGRTYLPRKFKIAVAPEGDNCVDVYTNDIGLVAHADGDELAGLTVLIGGGLGSTHGKSETYPRLATPFAHVGPHEVLEVCEAIVTVQRDYGDRTNRKHARMKYVVEERGVDWFRSEVERRIGRMLLDPLPVRFRAAEDHLGRHRQGDGTWFLGLHVPSGRVQDAAGVLLQSAMREVAQRFDVGFRITPQQNVLITGIGDEQRLEVEQLFVERGVEIDPAQLGVKRHALACPAIPTCGLAVAEAERALPSVLAELDRSLGELDLQHEAISIRMTGCPNGCARPRMGDIGIVGRSLGIYDIFVGGDLANTRLNTLFAKAVRLEQIVPVLRPLLEGWKKERFRDESFGDYWNRTAQRSAVNA